MPPQRMQPNRLPFDPAFWLWRTVYTWVLFPLALLLALALRRKYRTTLREQVGLWKRLRAQAAALPADARPVWFHVASAGEYIQALPVIRHFIGEGTPCALTYSSISARRWLSRREEELARFAVVDYLPPDLPWLMRRMVRILRPRALVFVKYDLWPNLVHTAHHAGVPQFLVAATLHQGSSRASSRLARALYLPLYRRMRGIYCVTEEDRQRFLQSDPALPAITLGDTKADAVLHRRDHLQPPPLPACYTGEPVLVVGSSWPADEAVIMPPLLETLRAQPQLKVLMVPHETEEPHLRKLEQEFAAQAPMRFSALQEGATPPEGSRVLIVDTVGQLSALYAHASMAYVGGGFARGVHNVLEPAAMGVPVLFGPRQRNAPEARGMAEAGAATTLHDAAGFAAALHTLITDTAARRAQGEKALAFAESLAGAAGHTHAAIREALS